MLITYIAHYYSILICVSHVAQYLIQWGSHILLFLWSGQDCGEMGFLLPRILLFSLTSLYFLSGCPAYTSCLANGQLVFI